MENNMEVKYDTIKVKNKIYKDTCIEKPIKIVYKTSDKPNSPAPINTAKNLNTGTNNGIIGDNPQVTVISNPQKTLPESDKVEILNYIKEFIKQNSLGDNYIIGVQSMSGNEDSYHIAEQIIATIKKAGYKIGNSPGLFTRVPVIKGIAVSKEGDNKILFMVGMLQ
jgi:hypothetical protein